MTRLTLFNEMGQKALTGEASGGRSPINSSAEVYDPYIHGTDSRILAMLRRTGFKLLSVLELLESYCMAPMSGELDAEYFQTGMDDIDMPKYISFGRLLADGANEYGLKKVSSSYTKYSLPTAEQSVAKVKSYASQSMECVFSDINKLLMNYARAKQLGVQQPLEQEKYSELTKNINDTTQLYYLFAILGKYISPNFELYRKVKQDLRNTVTDSPELRKKHKDYQNNFEAQKIEGIREEHALCNTFEQFIERQKDNANIINDFISAHFTFEKLILKIIELKVDVKSIYESPTPENLEKALKIFEFPKTSTIKTGIYNVEKEVTLSATQFFVIKSLDKPAEEKINEYDLCETFSGCLNNNARGIKIAELIKEGFSGSATKKAFENLANLSLQRVELLSKKLALLNKMYNIDIEKVKLSKDELEFMKDSFPLILACTNEKKVSLYGYIRQEYRAYEPLLFGKDITSIATDTEKHQLQVQEFLRENGVKNVKVVLIGQLASYIKDCSASQSSSTYSNDSRLLAWIGPNAAEGEKAKPDATPCLMSCWASSAHLGN